jgi:lipocalin
MLSKATLAVLFGSAAGACPPEDFSSIKDFDIDGYISKRWYIQQMMETSYLPKSHNWCVYAEYQRRPKKSFWGYDVNVHNHAEEVDGTIHDSNIDVKGGGIMAKIVDEKTGKLSVAPGFLPTFLSGPYWVIDYNEAEGYSLISGGAPKLDGEGGLCKTGSGVNDAGLWIFTRAQKTDDKLVAKVREIAKNKGFDLSVLNQVDHSNCTHSSSKRSSDVIV